MDDSSLDVILSRQSLRKALRRWTNLLEMADHPLAQLYLVEDHHRSCHRGKTRLEWGLSLRQVLHEAILTMQPHEGAPNYHDKHWFHYVILTEQYINRRSPEFVSMQLNGLPLRTYQEISGEALDRLASILLEREIAHRDKREQP
ncbi:MAG: hypothetical protein KC418_22415 [Anaerolineales bacterium]|nr:hypothetical protein [Anaerolineales bacterium]MCB8951535.1 hypothetical protein [Ardenticatenales bacterium]